jgi:hypothetical protein
MGYMVFYQSTPEQALYSEEYLENIANKFGYTRGTLYTLLSLPILKITSTDQVGVQTCYFSHNMFQSFVLAYVIHHALEKHYGNLPIKEAKLFIQRYRYHPSFQLVWPFLAGLIAENEHALKSFFECLHAEPRDYLGLHTFCIVTACLNECIIQHPQSLTFPIVQSHLITLQKYCGSLLNLPPQQIPYYWFDAVRQCPRLTHELQLEKLLVEELQSAHVPHAIMTANYVLLLAPSSLDWIMGNRESSVEYAIKLLQKILSDPNYAAYHASIIKTIMQNFPQLLSVKIDFYAILSDLLKKEHIQPSIKNSIIDLLDKYCAEQLEKDIQACWTNIETATQKKSSDLLFSTLTYLNKIIEHYNSPTLIQSYILLSPYINDQTISSRLRIQTMITLLSTSQILLRRLKCRQRLKRFLPKRLHQRS